MDGPVLMVDPPIAVFLREESDADKVCSICLASRVCQGRVPDDLYTDRQPPIHSHIGTDNGGP